MILKLSWLIIFPIIILNHLKATHVKLELSPLQDVVENTIKLLFDFYIYYIIVLQNLRIVSRCDLITINFAWDPNSSHGMKTSY